VLTVVGSF
jgi:hypothetical protein